MDKDRKKAKRRGFKPYYLLLIANVALLLLITLYLDRTYAKNDRRREAAEAAAAAAEVSAAEAAAAEVPAERSAGGEGPAAPQGTAVPRNGPPAAAGDAGRIPQKEVPKELPPKTTETPPVRPAAESKGTLVFVIDDVGNNLEQLDRFLKIPGPLVFAVMPDCPHTTEAVRRIHAAGKMAILHQPMEAVGGSNPGGGAIYAGMSRDEVFAVMDGNLAQTGPLPGINNHMGSKVTTDPATMGWVVEYLREKDMFFLDSATNTGLVAEDLSRKAGLAYTKRNSMFLDNESDKDKIHYAITEGQKTAENRGHAIMIGHVMTDTLAELLLELYPDFAEEGFTLKDLNEFFRGAGDADPRD